MEELNIEERTKLLLFARNTILLKDKEWLKKNEIELLSDTLKKNRGGFVTINNNKKLRGCIGYIQPLYPLYKTVIENAFNSAYCDPRFPPLTEDEINIIHIEISVLSIPIKLIYKDSDDLLKKIFPFKDGVIIKKDFFSATFLPQVWEQLPEKQEFLNHLCMKAGLKPDEWKDGNLDVEIYNAEVFKENV
jgi:AmmeMemoRadiSam system protein A